MRLDQSERDIPQPMAVWDATTGTYIPNVQPAEGADPISITPIDAPPWQPEQDTSPDARHPIVPQQSQPSQEQIRSQYFKNPTPQRQATPQAAPEDSGGGFDVQRALMGLTHGVEGIRAVDSGRAQQAQTKMAQQKHSQELAMGQFSLEEQKKRAALLQQAADPASPVSAKMRDELATGFGIIGQSMPGLKPQLDAMQQRIGNMSATEMLSLQERMGGIFNLARQAAHDKATESMAQRKLDDSAANTAAINADRDANRSRMEREFGEKKAEREDARTERDTAAYGKDVAPIDDALFNADNALEAKKKVSTGKIQNFVHEVRKAVGVPNKDMVELESSAGALGAGIRHAISGGAVTPEEGKYLLKQLAELDQGDAEYDIKLQKIHERLMHAKQRVKTAHPRATGAKESTGAEGIDPDKAAKITLARQALSDPEATPEDKAAAQRILAKYGK
jgi:hypothetical protein